MRITNIADSINQTISNATDTLSLSYTDSVSLVGNSMCRYEPFQQNHILSEKVYGSVSDVFGQAAVIHSDLGNSVLTSSNIESFDFAVLQYVIIIGLLFYLSLLIYKFSNYVGRLLLMAFSFPVLHRHLNSTNNTLDNMARYISFAIFPIATLLLLSFNRYYSDILPVGDNINLQIFLLNAAILGCFISTFIFRKLFYIFNKKRFFFKRLFVADRICVSSYILIYFPLVLLSSVDNPYRNLFVSALLLVLILSSFHNIVTILKLFIEEKVSYVQLILYFCTVKAVIFGVILFLALYIYNYSSTILFI